MLLFDFIIRKRSIQTQQAKDCYRIKVNNMFVSMDHPAFGKKLINWKDIEEIKIITEEKGQAQTNVHMALYGKDKKCILPQGIPEYQKVYGIVSQFDNFNFENVIASIGCLETKEFLVWRRRQS